MIALLLRGLFDFRRGVDLALEPPPKKTAGPWVLFPEDGLWLRADIGPTGIGEDGEQQYVGAVAADPHRGKFWWAAADDVDAPIGSLGEGWAEDVAVGKSLVDVRLVMAGWTLKL